MKSSNFLIESFLPLVEGIQYQPYLDTGNIYTVGIGHVLNARELREWCVYIGGIKHRFPLSRDDCFNLMVQDLRPFERILNHYLLPVLEQWQYDCLTSFIFNVGTGQFLSSTLLKRVNAGRFDDVPNQLRRWIYDNGKQIEGLINRRTREVKLWEGRYNVPIPQIKPIRQGLVNLL